MEIKTTSENKCFNGIQGVYSHSSIVCGCQMNFGLFLPQASKKTRLPVLWYLSGLTCTHENAMTKAGAQNWAARHGIALIFPDTSPRGKQIPDSPNFDLGQGAGFYLDATREPWKKNFNMETYIKDELSRLVFNNFSLDFDKQGITGHSMGGMGAINLAIKNPDVYKSVSAFSPIANPSQSDWGIKQFTEYLGNDDDIWRSYDPSTLLFDLGYHRKFLVDQGTSDNFINLLQPKSLEVQISSQNLGQFRYQKGYDHSYFFVSSFMKDHIGYHAANLTNK